MYDIEIYGLSITLSSCNIHIENSYNVSLPIVMNEILDVLRKEVKKAKIMIDNPLNYRSNQSLINEWIAHNNLYILGFETERTKNVDFDYPQTWYVKLGYWLLSRFVL